MGRAWVVLLFLAACTAAADDAAECRFPSGRPCPEGEMCLGPQGAECNYYWCQDGAPVGTAVACQAQTSAPAPEPQKVRCDPSGLPRMTPPPSPCPLGELQAITDGGSWAGRCVALSDCLPIACDPAFSDGCPSGSACGGAGVCVAPRATAGL